MVRLDRITMQGFKSFANRVTIPFPSGFSAIAGPNGSGKSTRGDTQVLLATGEIKPIKELVENALDKTSVHVELDDGVFTYENHDRIKVLGLDTSSMKIVEKDISAFVKREGEKHLYQIRTGTGRSVTTTGCHPVMIYRDGKIVSEIVENLRENDFIAAPRKLELPEHELAFEGIKVDEDFARFIGYLVGDGYITHDRIEIVNAENAILDDFERLAPRFGLKIKYKKKTSETGKATRLICWNNVFPPLMQRLFRSDSVYHLTGQYKIIPPEIMLSKKTVIANFLGGLFDCDATVRKDNPTFEYTTKNEKLADQVHLSLLRFGIVARKEAKIKHATNTKLQRKLKYFYIVVEGKEKLLQLYRNIPMRSEHKSARLKRHASKDIISGSNMDVLPQEVNLLVKDCTNLLGIKMKRIRRKYPWFAAYNENRCCPTRRGMHKTLQLFREKYSQLEELRKNICPEKTALLEALDMLNIRRRHASTKIGLQRDVINNSWIFRNSVVRKQDIGNLHCFVKKEVLSRLEKAGGIMNLLENLSSSDIFWDRISKIEKVPGEEWVYDLTIPNCHNFIGNGIFVHNSNVIDALTFVLGTTSARSIRAQKLQNLIFNGGRSRKPSDFCEVSIYLDNSDSKIPLPDKEIKITRRVTRSGISVYKLNGRTVTRTKILDILSQASLSSDGYNIIMQGDVTRIIEMSAAERKEIIDDISGISEFNEKRDKAAAELEKVELRVRENMIVVAEKQRLVARLKEDKENAEKYMKLESELKKSKASLVKKRLDETDEKMSVLNKEIDENTKVFGKLEKEFSTIDADLERKEKLVLKKSEQILEKSRNIEILRKIDTIQTEMVRKNDKIDFNGREIERLKSMSAAAERNLAVKEVLKMGRSDVHGTVISLVKIPNKYSTALEVAIGRHSSDLVVDNEETASFCINALKEKRIGRARFLPLTKMMAREKKPHKYRDVIGYAIDLVEYDKRYGPAMKYVLGSTLVVDNIDIAKRMKGFRVVTLDGDLVEVSGAMIGGFYKKRKGIQSFSGEIAKLEEENSRMFGDIGELENELVKLRGAQQEESKEVAKLQELKTQEEQALEDLRKRRKDLYEERLNLQGKISRMRIDQARLEATMDNLKIEFEDYKEVTEYFKQSQEELQERVRSLLIEINRLGPVNMKAVEEFNTINVEFEELKRKLDRLLEEKDAVIKVVREIETRRYDKFMETFSGINKNFGRIYNDLTGGAGELRLEVENNIDSGLIITANPSGKKILNLDSMSGGEKTMASLSFLFAIMQHYASPFYVLDEIDAALDKANTKKVANGIKKYSKNVQFIVITHNDFTISEADKVFGVSMEDGVSRVFGIDISKG